MFGRRASPNVVPLEARRTASQSVGEARGHFGREAAIEHAIDAVMPRLLACPEAENAHDQPRDELAAMIAAMVDAASAECGPALEPDARRDAVTVLLNELLLHSRKAPRPASLPEDRGTATSRDSVEEAKRRIQPLLMERIDAAKASATPREELSRQIGDIAAEILAEEKLQLNLLEQRDLVTLLLDEMLGLGPLEPLLADETITDIMVNGAKQVFVERQGRIELSDAQFRDDAHVMNIAGRIVSTVGRRVDESSPLVDARLADGSRVNIIIPPLAIDGPTISIRKFAKKKITLDIMEEQ